MKKYLFLISLAALTFTGCSESELDIDQKGVLPMEGFYQTDADAEAALATVYYDTFENFAFMGEVTGYNYGPYFGLTNYQGDDIYMAGSGPEDCVTEREFHDFRYTNDNIVVLGGYTAFYRSIQKCNLVITNFTEERLGTLSAKMKQCVAEARAMRAFDHLMLAIYWGTPPIVEEVINGAARPENAESQAAVLDWVVKEIDLALPDLTERTSPTDKAGAVRVTKGFANAIKGKALLWKGDYANAKTALATVINSGKYSLVPSERMIEILHADGKANEEQVFEFNIEFDPSLVDYFSIAKRTGWNAHMTFNWRFENMGGSQLNDTKINNNGWGWMNPTGDFARALIANDGMESARRKAWIMTYDEYLYNAQWINDPQPFVPGKTDVKAKDATRGLNKVGVYACEGFFNWKTVVHKDQNDICSANEGQRNFSIMRYPEVLLMYAECCAMAGDADGSGLRALNMIQDRAQAQHRSTQCTLDEVKKEKMFELWMEGCRSADLMRWKDYSTFEKADSYVPTFRDKLAEGQSTEHEGFIDASGADFYKKTYPNTLGFKKGKHELLPFPKRVTDLNSGITQNPGWN
ncbi:MAG: RagB/SusD family nutrient uptake outer membrane protein [Prevotellaceae bacterium]|nr:RagB/SusD family nutrient uptake outer membrane protein [Prevotellaceae bacterium]